MIFATDHGSRPVGTPSRICCPITVCCTFDFVSTVGESPVTVIDSVTLPTSSVAFTVAVNDALIWIASRVTVLNPGSSNFTVYKPGGRRSKRYAPVASVTCVCTPPINRSPDSEMVTPGSTALLGSDATQTIDPVWTCACALAATNSNSAQISIRLTVFFCLPPTRTHDMSAGPATIRGNSMKVKNLQCAAHEKD